jgi:hypothetical protein
MELAPPAEFEQVIPLEVRVIMTGGDSVPTLIVLHGPAAQRVRTLALCESLMKPEKS